MPSCIFKHCKSCSQKQKKEDGISFHRLPTDVVLRDKWIRIIRQNRQDNDWLPSKFCVVCSLHFKDNDYYFTEKGRRLIKKTSKPTQNLCKLPTSPETSSDNVGSGATASEDHVGPSDLLKVNQLPGKFIANNTVGLEKPTQILCTSSTIIKEESNVAEGLMSTIALGDQADPLNLLEFLQIPGKLKTENTVEPETPTQNLCASSSLIKEESSDAEGLMNTFALENQADPIKLFIVNQVPGKLITDTVVPEKPTQNLCVTPPLIQEESSDSEGSMNTNASDNQAGPSKLLEVNQLPGKSITGNSVDPELSDSDNSIFDTPRKYKLRTGLRKHKLLRVTMKRKIKALQQRNRRLEKSNAALKNIIKDLLQQAKSQKQNNVEGARH